MAVKSDRLKKLEAELADLEQWMKLGLVPKKEIERHKDEIDQLQQRIDEEKHRLHMLKESGDMEEYSAPRRTPAKTVYPDTPSLSEVDYSDESTDAGLDMESETAETEAAEEAKETAVEDEIEEEDEDDPFSDKNRWKRGGIIDPDATEW